MKTAFSYIRFSRGHQADGDSLSRQTAATELYCRQNNLVLDTSLNLRDLGVSAFKGRNAAEGALGSFIVAAESGRIPTGSALIVESLDRLSRQTPRKTVGLLNRLLDSGVEVHVTAAGKVFRPNATADEGIDLILAVAMAMRANEESEVKSMRLKSAFAAKRKKAEEGKALVSVSLPWWLALTAEKKIVCPSERRAVLTEIFRKTASGWSSAQVARFLNTQKTPTWRKSRVWGSARVRGTVRSNSPLGILEQTDKTKRAGREYSIPGYYPSVIVESLALKARATLKKNDKVSRGRPPATDRPANLLRGLLFYQDKPCRWTWHRNGMRDATTGKKAAHGYYELFNDLEGKLRFIIAAKQLEPVLIKGLLELKKEDLTPTTSLPRRSLALKDLEQDYQKKISNLLRLVEAGTGQSQSLAKRLSELESKLAETVAEIKNAESQETLAPIPLTPPKKSLSGDLNIPASRTEIAAAINRLVNRIDIAEFPGDLPQDRYDHKKFIHAAFADSRVIPDPVPDTKRRKTLWLLVTFTNQVQRLICRLEDPTPNNSLFTCRWETT